MNTVKAWFMTSDWSLLGKSWLRIWWCCFHSQPFVKTMSIARSRSRSAQRPEHSVQQKPPQFIVLDCRPGLPRPGDLLPAALKGTSLKVQPPVSKMFGEWTWDYSHIPEQEFRENIAKLSSNIRKLHRDGEIRFGSWWGRHVRIVIRRSRGH